MLLFFVPKGGVFPILSHRPCYIEGRNGRCQENQRNHADILDVRS
nr:MAG TPA: hypothetical protein [Caudoviricetes sp.]